MSGGNEEFKAGGTWYRFCRVILWCACAWAIFLTGWGFTRFLGIEWDETHLSLGGGPSSEKCQATTPYVQERGVF